MLAAGVALLAGAVAAALVVGAGDSALLPYTPFAGLAGLVLLFVGLLGVPPSEGFVPSPAGRYVRVDVAPTPAQLEEQERYRKRGHRWTIVRETGVAVCLVVVVLEYLRGDLDIALLAIFVPFVGPVMIDAVRRRMKSEAEVSTRFLQSADPRHPLTAPYVAPAAEADALPAGSHAAVDAPDPTAPGAA